MKLSLITPQCCMFCRNNACYDDLPVCRDCVHRLYTLLTEHCKTCGGLPSECTCVANRDMNFLFFYGSPDSKWIMYNVKTDADRRVLYFLVDMLIKYTGIDPTHFDGVTYVPRKARNRRLFGYDQSFLIAEAISRRYSIPLIKTLKRSGGTEQKLLSVSQRRSNMQRRYVPRDIPAEKYKKLLLVDDVSTTGATMNVCASIIRKYFAHKITKLVIAKTNFTKEPNGG